MRVFVQYAQLKCVVFWWLFATVQLLTHTHQGETCAHTLLLEIINTVRTSRGQLHYQQVPNQTVPID
uniref:Secreted protein n=1 Tax=Anopheles quadriannulatus TaxID=34691 RepID=A0A182XU13_ANOQN